MCQITYANFGSKKLNITYTIMQSMKNSEALNRDGYGFWSADSVFKSEKTPNLVTNLYEVYNTRIDGNNPICSHVRQATTTNGVKKILSANSHPFITDRFFLVHNGSLETREWKIMREDRFKDMIDSQIFTCLLQETADKNTTLSFPELLKLTMEMFKGKFAFIIKDNNDGNTYAAVGKSAKLHLARFNNLDGNGKYYVINTEEKDLERIASIFIQIVTPMRRMSIEGITKLESESIFLLTNNVEKVGEIKEVENTFNRGIVVYNRGTHDGLDDDEWENWYQRRADENSAKSDVNTKKLFEVSRKYSLDLYELEGLSLLLMGKSLLSLLSGEIEKLSEKINNLAKEFFNDEKESCIKIIDYYLSREEFYELYNVQFPYFLTRIKGLRRISEKLAESEEGTV